jgi:hypothetical protein
VVTVSPASGRFFAPRTRLGTHYDGAGRSIVPAGAGRIRSDPERYEMIGPTDDPATDEVPGNPLEPVGSGPGLLDRGPRPAVSLKHLGYVMSLQGRDPAG